MNLIKRNSKRLRKKNGKVRLVTTRPVFLSFTKYKWLNNMVHLAPAQRFHPRINKKVSITAGGSLGHFPQGARP